MKRLCENKHWKLNKDYDTNKILYLLIDRPIRINFWNDFVWENNKGQFHREYDLPAIIIYNDGYTAWFKNNKRYKN